MARYDVRDLLGHFVKPPGAEFTPCPHACCRGRRAHPDGKPVVLSRGELHAMSEAQLLRHMRKAQAGENYAVYERSYRQVIAEMDRRENAARRKEKARKLRRVRGQEHHEEVERQFWAAERATHGYMLNKRGRAAGIDERSLFTGPESRVRAYASPELLNWFAAHGRPTRTSFLGTARERRAEREGQRIYA